MEEVIFDNKTYVKASVLAKRFNYTQDYLGQLCRAKKVDARLVGRAWYLNLASLEKHKKARYRVEPTTEKKENRGVTLTAGNFLSRVDVIPVGRHKPVEVSNNDVFTRFPKTSVRYEVDDHALIPSVNSTPRTSTMAVSLADSVAVPVQEPASREQMTSFVAEPLPEVYLKGQLKINRVPDDVRPPTESETDQKDAVETKDTEQKTNSLKQSTRLVDSSINSKKTSKIKLYRHISKQNLQAKQFAKPAKLTTAPAVVKRVVRQDTSTVVPVAPLQPVGAATLKPSETAANLTVIGILSLSFLVAVLLFSVQTETVKLGAQVIEAWYVSPQRIIDLVHVVREFFQ